MISENYDPVDILNIPLEKNDAGASTIREYLVTLLLKLWSEGGDFNSIKPFGSYNWEYELYLPLVKSGYVSGEMDEFEILGRFDLPKAAILINQAIEYLGK